MDILICSSLVLIFSIFFLKKCFQNQKTGLPPSPPSFPIIGHLHLLKKPLQLHRTFRNLSNKYGPAIFLKFGNRPVLLVSSSSIAEECFTKNNDIIFSNRPKCIIGDHLSYNQTTISFSLYGDHFRNLRRVTNNFIFSTTALNNFSDIRTQEIRSCVRKLCYLSTNNNGNCSKVSINLKSLFNELVLNVFMKVLVGREADPETEKAAFSGGVPVHICDFVPFFRWIGFGGFEKHVKLSFFPAMDGYMQSLIEESRRKVIGTRSSDNTQNMTILQSLLSVQEADPEYTDDIIKGIVQEIIGGGPDTSATALHWVMSLLLNHPEVMDKVRNEIDFHTKSERLIEDSDLPNLPYLSNVINETQRLFPATPILIPRLSSESCTVGGYNIPKETILLVNAWVIHRDGNVWEEPEKFRPERFNKTKKGSQGFKFMPFGAGRRPCPGAGMANRIIGLIVATMVQCFEWERIGPELVDLEEGSGLVLHKVKPTEAFYRPRSSMQHLIS